MVEHGLVADEADFGADGHAGRFQRIAEKFQRAGGRRDEGGEDFQQGAFAGAVGTQESNVLASGDIQVDVAEDGAVFDGFADVEGVDGEGG